MGMINVNGHGLLSDSVREAIDSIKIGQVFYAADIKKKIARKHPSLAEKYPDTFMRVARAVRRYSFVCVEQRQGKYIRVMSPDEKAGAKKI